MGAFFTNVQVRIARGGDIASVARVLRELLAEGDCTMARDDEPADRTVLLSRSGDWVAVYDEGTDTGAVALDDLADVLSRALETHALAVRVHDSDVLEIELFENGDLLDRYNSAPDYFGEVSDEERKELAGEPPRWTAVLAEGHDANELAAVFGESRLFCEETLRKVGALLGIDPAQIGVGYRYAAQGEGPKDRVALRFRLSQRPAYERRRTGAPRLGLPYGFDRMPSPRPGTSYEAMVGSPLQVSARGQNLGGASRGVRVVVEGDALDRDLVRITKVNAVVGVPQEGNWGEGEPSVERSADGKVRVVTTMPDLPIPAGIEGDVDALMRAHPHKMIELMHAANVHTNVHAEVRAAGTSSLRITIVPIEAPEGALVETCDLRIERAAPRPLRAEADLHPHQLKPLEDRSTLFLLVSLDLPRAEAARFAASAAKEWRPFVDTGKLQASIFHSDPGSRPTSGASVDWEKLEETFRTTQVVAASTSPMGGGKGFSFGTSILPREAGDDPECPTLGLWIDAAGSDPKAAALLSRLAERAMTEARGVQALVARWGWAPSYHLTSTPYESACGVHGETLRRSWLTRFVRGVAPGELWLGQELVAHVDRDAVARSAKATSRGPALRIEIDDAPDAVRAVEEAIATLLPTIADVVRAMNARR